MRLCGDYHGGVEKLIIVGLGNPGNAYAGHRHNVGFWCLNRLARRHGIDFKAGKTASTGRGRIGGGDVLLVKPRTYVNRSGLAVGPLAQREHVPASNVIVVYDELDLPQGRLRLRRGGGTGGHNGLKSIAAALASEDFGRVRIGIGRPEVDGVPSWDPEVVAGHVLAKPASGEKRVLDAGVERAVEAIEVIIAEGWERAMNRFNAAEA